MRMVGVWQGIKGLTDLGGLIKHKYMCTCVNDSSFIEFIYNVLDFFYTCICQTAIAIYRHVLYLYLSRGYYIHVPVIIISLEKLF